MIEDCHIDALRPDAVHSIHDASEKHILQEIGERVRESVNGRLVHVIAENDLNDVRVITPCSEGGYGLDAQWSDDFHHALHSVLTRPTRGILPGLWQPAPSGQSV